MKLLEIQSLLNTHLFSTSGSQNKELLQWMHKEGKKIWESNPNRRSETWSSVIGVIKVHKERINSVQEFEKLHGVGKVVAEIATSAPWDNIKANPIIDNEIPMHPLNDEQQHTHDNAHRCYLCNKDFNDTDKELTKVRDHDHYTGIYRGAAHSCCNRALVDAGCPGSCSYSSLANLIVAHEGTP